MWLFNSVAPAAVNEDEIGPYWTPLGLVLRLRPDGKVEATDVHDDVSGALTLFHYQGITYRNAVRGAQSHCCT